MRIAFLCKRHYMSKDVIIDRYARLYEIPRQLACLGNEVQCFCLSYQKTEEGEWLHEAGQGSLHWQSQSLGLKVLLYPFQLLSQLRAFKPDIILGASDIPHVVLGAWLAQRLVVPFVADLYDNFESFGQAHIPGFVPLLRRAVCSADLVLTTSEPLREHVLVKYQARGDVVAMPSSIDSTVFHPKDKQCAREILGLPQMAKLIGTAGGLYRDKGITDLYEAWPLLAERFPDVHLVLAGSVEQGVPYPEGARVHYLGLLSHDKVAQLFNALDVGVMCIPDTAFGRYCFPQKAYEMLACRLPVVASAVGAMRPLLAPQFLFEAGNTHDLAEKVALQLTSPALSDIPINDWSVLLERINKKLMKLTSSGNVV